MLPIWPLSYFNCKSGKKLFHDFLNLPAHSAFFTPVFISTRCNFFTTSKSILMSQKFLLPNQASNDEDGLVMMPGMGETQIYNNICTPFYYRLLYFVTDVSLLSHVTSPVPGNLTLILAVAHCIRLFIICGNVTHRKCLSYFLMKQPI